MTPEDWTKWPSREALSREGLADARRWLARLVRLVVLAVLVWTIFSRRHVADWGVAAAVGGLSAVVLCAWAFYHATLHHALWRSVGLLVLLVGAGFAAHRTGFEVVAIVLWCGCALTGMRRLPLVAALPITLATLTGFVL
ncbi:sensor histidine kinase, partial [Streptomyces sp. NPDC087850]